VLLSVLPLLPLLALHLVLLRLLSFDACVPSRARRKTLAPQKGEKGEWKGEAVQESGGGISASAPGRLSGARPQSGRRTEGQAEGGHLTESSCSGVVRHPWAAGAGSSTS